MVEYPNLFYVFVIDTNSYSGNFEREMAAFITGHVGECGAGKEWAKQCQKPLSDKFVLYLPDEHGCCRPVSIWETPHWFNDGNGNHYREKDNDTNVTHKHPAYQSVAIFLSRKPNIRERELLKDRAYNFVLLQAKTEKPIIIEGFRLIERKMTDNQIQI